MCMIYYKYYKFSFSEYTSSPDNASEPKGQPRLVCKHCQNTYKNKNSLIRHSKFECGKQPSFTCNICGRKFKRKDHLTRHIKHAHLLWDTS